MPSSLDRAISRHRAALRSIDRAAMAELLTVYQDIEGRLAGLITALQQQALADGIVTPYELFQMERWRELQMQTATELERLARATGDVTAEAQARAIRASLNGTADLAEAAAKGESAKVIVARNWTQLPTSALEDLVGATRAGPLAELLATFGDDGARVITEQLVSGMAEGAGPRSIADAITKGLDISRNRALTVARTETLRASRSAALETYRQNNDVLSGWIWSAAKDEGTCAACLAMDGTEHPHGEMMDSHVNCRCSAIPWLRDIPMADYETGEDWLARQDADTQDGVLGKAGGEAYRAGEVALSDFVRRDVSETWGASLTDGGIAFARWQAGQGRMAA